MFHAEVSLHSCWLVLALKTFFSMAQLLHFERAPVFLDAGFWQFTMFEVALVP